MDPSARIAFWAAAFVLSHLIISSNAVRPRLIARVGEQPYRGIYSLVAAGTLVPLCIVFARNKHAGAMLWMLRGSGAARGLVWILMLAALVFFAGSFVNPSAAQMGAPQDALRPRGISKITRHPSFVAFGLFGGAHMIMNGWVGDLTFFAMFPVLAISGGIHQDARKLATLGEPYRAYLKETSFIPFGAIFSGRQKFGARDVPWIPLALGIGLAIVVIIVHPYVFGGSPLR